jgi:hypothetical protein
MTRKEALEKGELIYDGRPHRCGMSDDEALSIIKRCREVKTWLFNTQGRT